MAAQLDESALQRSFPCKTVIVTGFSSFGIHKVNASWESVKLLKDIGLENELDIELIVEEIPVIYDKVDEKIPDLWRKYNPLLVVHVGVSHLATCLNIENCAERTGYVKPDVCEALPSCGKGCLCSISKEDSEDCIQTNINVKKLSEDVNKMNSEVTTLVSTNAGSNIQQQLEKHYVGGTIELSVDYQIVIPGQQPLHRGTRRRLLIVPLQTVPSPLASQPSTTPSQTPYLSSAPRPPTEDTDPPPGDIGPVDLSDIRTEYILNMDDLDDLLMYLDE